MNMHVKPPKFKAGDTVRVVDEAGGHGLPLGATAKVTSVSNEEDGHEALVYTDKTSGGAFARRFELFAPKAKVGDKVRAKASIIDITAGREYEVVDIDEDGGVVVLDNLDDRWPLRDGEYDVVEVQELRVGTRLRYKGASNGFFTRGETYVIGRVNGADRFTITDNDEPTQERAKHGADRAWLLENFDVVSTFKIGDRIRGASWLSGTPREGVIVRMGESDAPYGIRTEDGDQCWIRAKGAELVAAATAYKVGDFVRATVNNIDLTKGAVYKVDSIPTDVDYPVCVRDDVGDTHNLSHAMFEKFEFRAGDRVKFINDMGRNMAFIGKTGALVRKDCGDWIVKLDERHTDGHRCRGATPDGFGRYANSDGLEPLTGKAKPAEAKPAEPKFKVGDRVRVKDTYPLASFRGKIGLVLLVYDDRLQIDCGASGFGTSTEMIKHLELAPPADDSVWQAMARDSKIGAIKNYREQYCVDLKEAKDAVEAWLSSRPDRAPTTGRAIVCKMDGDTPLPATRPFVHNSGGLALREARRLAELHGGTFGVYVLADAVKHTAPTYDHEWQRLAKAGAKIDAIKELRARTGLTLKGAKDAVEYWLSI